MGYYMHGGGSLNIRKENFGKVMAAALAAFDWLPDVGIHETDTVEDLLVQFGAGEVGYDAAGDICDIYFYETKANDQVGLFQVISPWVEDGSKIFLIGEDDAQWLWCWKDHEFYDCPAMITYVGDPYAGKE